MQGRDSYGLSVSVPEGARDGGEKQVVNAEDDRCVRCEDLNDWLCSQ
jgi:hypothetical protein